MNAPQIILIVLLAVGFGTAAAKHGEPSKPHNVVTSAISIALLVGLLWWGGFW